MGTVLRREPNIPLDAVRLAGCRNYVSGEKARRELGYETTPVEQGLREAAEYFLYEWQPDSIHDRISNLRPNAV